MRNVTTTVVVLTGVLAASLALGVPYVQRAALQELTATPSPTPTLDPLLVATATIPAEQLISPTEMPPAEAPTSDVAPTVDPALLIPPTVDPGLMSAQSVMPTADPALLVPVQTFPTVDISAAAQGAPVDSGSIIPSVTPEPTLIAPTLAESQILAVPTVDNPAAVPTGVLVTEPTSVPTTVPTVQPTATLTPGLISGTVWSQSGGLVIISVRDAAGAVVTSGVSNPDGSYRLTEVAAGDYTLSFDDGVSLVEQRAVRVEAGLDAVQAPVALLWGDLNRDGRIDELDVVAIAALYGQAAPTSPVSFDVNGDGEIGLNELTIIAENMGTRR